jgi:hypothetical protein
LLNNGFSYNGIKHVSGTTFTLTTEAEPFKKVISTRFAEVYKKEARRRRTTFVFEKK